MTKFMFKLLWNLRASVSIESLMLPSIILPETPFASNWGKPSVFPPVKITGRRTPGRVIADEVMARANKEWEDFLQLWHAGQPSEAPESLSLSFPNRPEIRLMEPVPDGRPEDPKPPFMVVSERPKTRRASENIKFDLMLAEDREGVCIALQPCLSKALALSQARHALAGLRHSEKYQDNPSRTNRHFSNKNRHKRYAAKTTLEIVNAPTWKEIEGSTASTVRREARALKESHRPDIVPNPWADEDGVLREIGFDGLFDIDHYDARSDSWAEEEYDQPTLIYNFEGTYFGAQEALIHFALASGADMTLLLSIGLIPLASVHLTTAVEGGDQINHIKTGIVGLKGDNGLDVFSFYGEHYSLEEAIRCFAEEIGVEL